MILSRDATEAASTFLIEGIHRAQAADGKKAVLSAETRCTFSRNSTEDSEVSGTDSSEADQKDDDPIKSDT